MMTGLRIEVGLRLETRSWLGTVEQLLFEQVLKVWWRNETRRTMVTPKGQ